MTTQVDPASEVHPAKPADSKASARGLLAEQALSPNRLVARPAVLQLISELEANQQALDKTRRAHAEIKREMAVLCNPAHHLGTITEVERNGHVMVSVYVDGMPPFRS